MSELTKERLMAILRERIHEEQQGVETYNGIWEMIHKSQMPYAERRELMQSLNKITADEEIHIELLEEALAKLKRSYMRSQQ